VSDYDVVVIGSGPGAASPHGVLPRRQACLVRREATLSSKTTAIILRNHRYSKYGITQGRIPPATQGSSLGRMVCSDSSAYRRAV